MQPEENSPSLLNQVEQGPLLESKSLKMDGMWAQESLKRKRGLACRNLWKSGMKSINESRISEKRKTTSLSADNKYRWVPGKTLTNPRVSGIKCQGWCNMCTSLFFESCSWNPDRKLSDFQVHTKFLSTIRASFGGGQRQKDTCSKKRTHRSSQNKALHFAILNYWDTGLTEFLQQTYSVIALNTQRDDCIRTSQWSTTMEARNNMSCKKKYEAVAASF